MQKEVKVLFFTMSMMQGGAERVIATLCNNKNDTDDEVAILTVLNEKSEYCLPDHVTHCGIISGKDYFTKGKLRTFTTVCDQYCKMVREYSPDIIVSFLPEPCFISAIYKKKLGVPFIGSERGNPYYQFRNPVYKLLGNLLYSRADGFVFQTEGARSFFFRMVQKNSIIIGNPIRYVENSFIAQVDKKKEIVAVGRFTVEKNYPLLIRSFARVIEKHPEYTLHIFGKIEEVDDSLNLIKKLNLTEYVVLEGVTNDVQRKISTSYAYVLSSFTEGLPNSLMEAMAVGLPVIATDCPSGGPRQLIQNGINGLLVANRDEQGLEDAINKLIENPGFAEKLGRKAREIGCLYSEKKISKIWFDYIREVGYSRK